MQAASRMEAILGAHVKDFTNFRDETQKRALPVNHGIVLCLKILTQAPDAIAQPVVCGKHEALDRLDHNITVHHQGVIVTENLCRKGGISQDWWMVCLHSAMKNA